MPDSGQYTTLVRTIGKEVPSCLFLFRGEIHSKRPEDIYIITPQNHEFASMWGDGNDTKDDMEAMTYH